MATDNFLNKENIQMVWDVISDENIFKFLSPAVQKDIYNLFLNNLNVFYNNEKKTVNSLIELNKKYIILMLNHIKTTYALQPPKIKIHNERPTKEFITFEEIQNDKKNKTQQEFERMQEEFKMSMSVNPPPVPKFMDDKTDKPIKEIDKILKQMQLERNYEVEQISKNHNPNANDWLKPQETSFKQPTAIKDTENKDTDNHSRFKFLNKLDDKSFLDNFIKDTFSYNNKTNMFNGDHSTDNDDRSFLNNFKKVTFSDNNETNIFDEDHSINNNEEMLLFSKLKTVNKTSENNNQPELNEDRIDKLERNIIYLNEKVDKILTLLQNNN